MASGVASSVANARTSGPIPSAMAFATAAVFPQWDSNTTIASMANLLNFPDASVGGVRECEISVDRRRVVLETPGDRRTDVDDPGDRRHRSLDHLGGRAPFDPAADRRDALVDRDRETGWVQPQHLA